MSVDIKYFKDIPYEKATKEKYNLIKSRFEYSRRIYLEKDEVNYKKLISNAIKKAKLKRKINEIIYSPIRCAGYILKKIRINNPWKSDSILTDIIQYTRKLPCHLTMTVFINLC